MDFLNKTPKALNIKKKKTEKFLYLHLKQNENYTIERGGRKCSQKHVTVRGL